MYTAEWLNLKRFHVVILTNDNFFCVPRCVGERSGLGVCVWQAVCDSFCVCFVIPVTSTISLPPFVSCPLSL